MGLYGTIPHEVLAIASQILQIPSALALFTVLVELRHRLVVVWKGMAPIGTYLNVWSLGSEWLYLRRNERCGLFGIGMALLEEVCH